MNIPNLETFITVSRTANFSKAAEILYVTQSTVSARIKSLEDEMGVKLFDRDKHNVALTPTGEHFLSQATEIYKLLKTAQEDATFFDEYKERVSISAPESIWRYSLNSIVDEYREIHPDTAIKLESNQSETVIQGVLDGSIDLGVVFYKVMSDDMKTVPFCQSRFLLLGSQEVASKISFVTPDNIFDYSFIYCDWGIPMERWYRMYYKKRSHFCEIEGTSLFLDYILSGRGIGFLPDRIAGKYIDNGRLASIPFKYAEDTPIDQSYLIYLPHKEKKVGEIISLALDYIKNNRL